MKKNDQYSCGWINTTIHDFLVDGEFLPAYALVTCLDSTFDLELSTKTNASLGELRERGTWMQANHCSLGLGDGVGLNFCAKISGLARYLVDALSDVAAQTDQRGARIAIHDH
ncbi:MAG TPA: hypothetical protein VJ783_27040 [Pirellulales bacterium]|nr:hypothetical protein [Pirellulales bacterium]